ncbi:peptidoglycan-binding protein (plasmid) [Streptomyces sp. LZ34]
MESNVGVIHTTEGKTLPTYGGGASAPNFTAVPDFKNKRLNWHQHFDFDESARALVNKSGGVETNTANAVQVELVGTCDPGTSKKWGGKNTSHIFWPEAPDWALRELAKFVKWAHDKHGVRLASTVTWKAYPASYGTNGVRLTQSQWNAYYGWLGHQHVPENDHGDPGSLPFDKVLAYAKDASGPSKPDTGDSKPAPKPTPHYEPFPGASFFHGGRHSAVITAMGRRLVAEGCGAYRNGPGPDWTNADRESYRRWQKKLGYTGAAADGIPGKTSWDKLRVPNV